jgi:hypothetical protein
MASIEQTNQQAGVLRKRSRQLLLFAAMTAAMSGQACYAQTFAEWFKQKSTQKKYLQQQIVALNVYGGYLRNGYRIAKNGLGSIGSYIKNEFELHGSYYDHLKTVSPAVKNDPQIADILRWQRQIILTTASMRDQNGLTRPEHNYITKVRRALLDDCDARLHDLEVIIADQKITMSDEERLRQLGRLHLAMQDNYRFAASFDAQLRLYIRSKQQHEQNVNSLIELYAKH